MLLSVLVHLLAFLLWPSTPIPPFGSGGSLADPAFDRPEPIQLVQLPPLTDRAAAEPALPTASHNWSVVAVRQIAASPAALDLIPAKLSPGRPGITSSLRQSPGAPVESSDELYVQPIASGILSDWKPPVFLFGVAMTARVYLDAAGAPTALVELAPPTESQRMNRAIAFRVRTLEYQPARRGGEAVAAWAEITFVFCGENVSATSPAPATIPEGPCEDDADAEAVRTRS